MHSFVYSLFIFIFVHNSIFAIVYMQR